MKNQTIEPTWEFITSVQRCHITQTMLNIFQSIPKGDVCICESSLPLMLCGNQSRHIRLVLTMKVISNIVSIMM